MSNFPVRHQLAFGAEKAYSTRKATILGAYGETPDGRIFRYALNSSAAALAPGVPLQSAVQPAGSSAFADALVATLANGVGATVATGVTTIAITASTAIGADVFADGYLYVKVGPGAGAHVIKQHTSGSSLNSINIELYPGDKIDRVAHTTATRYALQKNLYADVIVAPATKTGVFVGVAHTSVPASNYFWAQVGGPTPANMHSATSAAGNTITWGTTAAEMIALTTVLGDQTGPDIGQSIHIAATTGVIDLVVLT